MTIKSYLVMLNILFVSLFTVDIPSKFCCGFWLVGCTIDLNLVSNVVSRKPTSDNRALIRKIWNNEILLVVRFKIFWHNYSYIVRYSKNLKYFICIKRFDENSILKSESSISHFCNTFLSGVRSSSCNYFIIAFGVVLIWRIKNGLDGHIYLLYISRITLSHKQEKASIRSQLLLLKEKKNGLGNNAGKQAK